MFGKEYVFVLTAHGILDPEANAQIRAEWASRVGSQCAAASDFR
jgi:hypothetical protein